MKKSSFRKVLVSFMILSIILTSSVFIVIPVLAIDGNYLGINAHPEANVDYMNEINQIIASGVKWIRISPEWGWVETSKGGYNTSLLTQIDTIVNTLTANGVNIDYVLCYTAKWASQYPSDADARLYRPADYGDWKNYVSFITNRYKGKVHIWEVWNEQDSPYFWKSSVNDYNTMLQYAYNQVKATDSTNTVLIGGLSFIDGNYGIGSWFDTLMSLGAASYFDKINYHVYGNSTRMRNVYNGVMSVVNKYSSQLGSKNIWLTETGYTTNGDIALEPYKADHMDQVYQLHKRYSNIERVFVYCYRNATSGNASEDNFGLVKCDLTPLKASYYYLSTPGAWSEFYLQNGVLANLTTTTLPLIYNKAGDGNSIVFTNGDMKIPSGTYMYMQLRDDWLYNTNNSLDLGAYIDVTYLDSGTSTWSLQYDGQSSIYTQPAVETKTNTGTYKTKTYWLGDRKFANRQSNSSDFRFYAISGDFQVKSVVVRKANRGQCVLGSTDTFRMLQHAVSTDPSNQAYNPPATVSGASCRQILDNNHYMFFTAGKGLAMEGDTNLRIGVTYFDSGTDKIRIDYNAVGNDYQPVYITKANTNTWKYKEISIADANFINKMSYGADFRIGNSYDGSIESISSVLLIR